MTDTQIKRIAESLSEAQRGVFAGLIMEIEPSESDALIDDGLIGHPTRIGKYGPLRNTFTPLGLRVRAYLLEQADG